jgi:oligosaccharide repeat unit polymerase
MSLYRLFDGSALLTLFNSGDAGEARLERLRFYMEGATVFGVPLKYLNIVYVFFEIVFVYLLMFSIISKKSFSWVLTLMLFISLSLWHMSNTSKGYVVVLFLYAFIIISVLSGMKFRVNSLIAFVLAALVPTTIITFYFMDTDGLLFWYPIERFLAGNFLPHYIIFDHFYDAKNLWGTSSPSWYTFGMHDQFLLAEWNWRLMHDKLDGGIAYNNPSSFVAEFYANFGILSPALWWLVLVYIGLISVLVIKVAPKEFKVIYLVYLTLYFSKYSVKEFIPTIFDYRLFFMVLFSLLFFTFFRKYCVGNISA